MFDADVELLHARPLEIGVESEDRSPDCDWRRRQNIRISRRAGVGEPQRDRDDVARQVRYSGLRQRVEDRPVRRAPVIDAVTAARDRLAVAAQIPRRAYARTVVRT